MKPVSAMKFTPGRRIQPLFDTGSAFHHFNPFEIRDDSELGTHRVHIVSASPDFAARCAGDTPLLFRFVVNPFA
jgi:hypothetical protein